jgi:hypothetical protein
LLDIKKLAEDESDPEALLGELFDRFNLDASSPLLGLMSPSKRQSKKLSRVTFNNAVKPVLSVFSEQDADTIYPKLRTYIAATLSGLNSLEAEATITNPIVFRSLIDVFPNVAERVRDRFGNKFAEDDFAAVLEPVFTRARSSWFHKPPKSYKDLSENLTKVLKNSFSI